MMCFENGSFYSSYGFCVFTSININVVIYLPKSMLYIRICVYVYIYITYMCIHMYKSSLSFPVRVPQVVSLVRERLEMPLLA